MNIHNLRLVEKLYEEYNDNRQQLANLMKSSHLLRVSFNGTDLGVDARISVLPSLVKHYQKKVDDLEKRLKHLGVDLSELPEEEEEE